MFARSAQSSKAHQRSRSFVKRVNRAPPPLGGGARKKSSPGPAPRTARATGRFNGRALKLFDRPLGRPFFVCGILAALGRRGSGKNVHEGGACGAVRCLRAQPPQDNLSGERGRTASSLAAQDKTVGC
jgi:hypothetical protein